MSESSETTVMGDVKKYIYQVVGFIFAAGVFGVCLQEVHIHGAELRSLDRHFELPIILTIADTVSLLFLLKVHCVDGLLKNKEGLIVTAICHVMMEYLLNFWYIYSRNDSFALGYFEPILLIILLKLCTKTEVNLKIVAVLVAMSFCAGLTSGEFGILLNANRNGIIIFLVVMFICMRNIGLKRLHDERVTLTFRKSVGIPYTVIVISIGVIMCAFHLTDWALPVLFAIVSMFASVTVLYLTSLLLESIHVISIAVLGMGAQICVNIVCIPVEHGHNVFISLLGVILLIVCLAAYVRLCFSAETFTVIGEPVPHHEVYTRIEFLIFAGLACGLIFYVFKPKLSERDLNNLHYVGLDNVVKRLLGQD